MIHAMEPAPEPSPYVTLDEVRRLLAGTVDVLTEGICAQLAAATPSPEPTVSTDALCEEVIRRLKPHLEEAVRKAVAESLPVAEMDAEPEDDVLNPDLLRRLKQNQSRGRHRR